MMEGTTNSMEVAALCYMEDNDVVAIFRGCRNISLASPVLAHFELPERPFCLSVLTAIIAASAFTQMDSYSACGGLLLDMNNPPVLISGVLLLLFFFYKNLYFRNTVLMTFI